MTNSCRSKDPGLELISVQELPRFPSASAVEYMDGKIFLFGDDAPYLLILDTDYRPLDTVQYINDTAYRVPKEYKADVEATAVLLSNHEKHLYALGSFATEQRRRIFSFPLNDLHAFSNLTDSLLLQNLKALPEVNIEGLAFVKSRLVLANRANTTHTMNRLLVLNNIFLEHLSAQRNIIDLDLNTKKVIGLSGLYYIMEKDVLLFTASDEDTPSATQDGIINDSYIGWLNGFSKKMNLKTIYPDRLINLTQISDDFKKQKIESVCLEKINNDTAMLHLAADNDNGQSRLFKMYLRFK